MPSVDEAKKLPLLAEWRGHESEGHLILCDDLMALEDLDTIYASLLALSGYAMAVVIQATGATHPEAKAELFQRIAQSAIDFANTALEEIVSEGRTLN